MTADYKIVTAYEIAELIRLVDIELKCGYTPLGGVVCDNDVVHQTMYCPNVHAKIDAEGRPIGPKVKPDSLPEPVKGDMFWLGQNHYICFGDAYFRCSKDGHYTLSKSQYLDAYAQYITSIKAAAEPAKPVEDDSGWVDAGGYLVKQDKPKSEPTKLSVTDPTKPGAFKLGNITYMYDGYNYTMNMASVTTIISNGSYMLAWRDHCAKHKAKPAEPDNELSGNWVLHKEGDELWFSSQVYGDTKKVYRLYGGELTRLIKSMIDAERQ